MGFPANPSARHAYILDRVRQGQYYAQWVPLTVREGGNTATFWVLGDALKVDGIRVIATAKLEQQIADALDASLLTPKLADLIFVNAKVRLDPILRTPDATMDATDTMIRQSLALDQATGGCTDCLVSTVGKHWTISNGLLAKPGMAENYGFHYWRGQKKLPSDSLPVIGDTTDSAGRHVYLHQGQGWRHNAGHSDYSQNVVLVSNWATLNGKKARFQDIATSPEFASLVSHEGPLQVLRQPDVPQEPAIA